MPDTGTIRWTCGCCGGQFEGLTLDFAFRLPDDLVARAHQSGTDVAATRDFCSDGSAHYVRCVLAMPVDGLGDELRWGVWIQVDEAGLARAAAMHDRDAAPDEAGLTGKLANALPPFPGSIGHPVTVRFRTRDLCPLAYADGEGGLAEAQGKGIGRDIVEGLNRPFHRH